MRFYGVRDPLRESWSVFLTALDGLPWDSNFKLACANGPGGEAKQLTPDDDEYWLALLERQRTGRYEPASGVMSLEQFAPGGTLEV